MPIRFRCPSCGQLLGIARRKAGTAVQCPTCHAQVAVPFQDQPEAPPPPAAPPALFERDDFDAYLCPPLSEGTAGCAPTPSPVLNVPAPPAPLPPEGIFLSPTRATVLTVVMILLVALAFGSGLLIGRYLLD
jgi:phage FluMu protein Com